MTASLVLDIVKLTGASVAFGVGLWQYRRAQAWKRMEFLAQQVEKFRADPMVKRVFLMLDWSERWIDFGLDSDFSTFEIGEKTLPPEKLPKAEGKHRITYKIVESALTPHQARSSGFTPVETAIRDHFDVFLDYLSHFETFIQAGLVKPKEIGPYLNYWTNALAGNDNIDRDMLCQFWRFVDFYRYRDARNLITRFHPNVGSDFPDNAPSAAAAVQQ